MRRRTAGPSTVGDAQGTFEVIARRLGPIGLFPLLDGELAVGAGPLLAKISAEGDIDLDELRDGPLDPRVAPISQPPSGVDGESEILALSGRWPHALWASVNDRGWILASMGTDAGQWVQRSSPSRHEPGVFDHAPAMWLGGRTLAVRRPSRHVEWNGGSDILAALAAAPLGLAVFDPRAGSSGEVTALLPLPNDVVTDMVAFRSGVVHVLDATGAMYRASAAGPGLGRWIRTRAVPAGGEHGVHRLFAGRSSVWVRVCEQAGDVLRGAQLWRLVDESWRREGIPVEGCGWDFVEAGDGALWIADGTLWRRDDAGRWEVVSLPRVSVPELAYESWTHDGARWKQARPANPSAETPLAARRLAVTGAGQIVVGAQAGDSAAHVVLARKRPRAVLDLTARELAAESAGARTQFTEACTEPYLHVRELVAGEWADLEALRAIVGAVRPEFNVLLVEAEFSAGRELGVLGLNWTTGRADASPLEPLREQLRAALSLPTVEVYCGRPRVLRALAAERGGAPS